MNQNRAAFRVLGPGPLPADDILRFADVYLRGMQEVSTGPSPKGEGLASTKVD